MFPISSGLLMTVLLHRSSTTTAIGQYESRQLQKQTGIVVYLPVQPSVKVTAPSYSPSILLRRTELPSSAPIKGHPASARPFAPPSTPPTQAHFTQPTRVPSLRPVQVRSVRPTKGPSIRPTRRHSIRPTQGPTTMPFSHTPSTLLPTGPGFITNLQGSNGLVSYCHVANTSSLLVQTVEFTYQLYYATNASVDRQVVVTEGRIQQSMAQDLLTCSRRQQQNTTFVVQAVQSGTKDKVLNNNCSTLNSSSSISSSSSACTLVQASLELVLEHPQQRRLANASSTLNDPLLTSMLGSYLTKLFQSKVLLGSSIVGLSFVGFTNGPVSTNSNHISNGTQVAGNQGSPTQDYQKNLPVLPLAAAAVAGLLLLAVIGLAVRRRRQANIQEVTDNKDQTFMSNSSSDGIKVFTDSQYFEATLDPELQTTIYPDFDFELDGVHHLVYAHAGSLQQSAALASPAYIESQRSVLGKGRYVRSLESTHMGRTYSCDDTVDL
jgi:hypothetical protein